MDNPDQEQEVMNAMEIDQGHEIIESINVDLQETEDSRCTLTKKRFIAPLYRNFATIYGNLLHIYFIVVFEIIFYFGYVVKIEYSEMKRILRSFSRDIKEYVADMTDLISDDRKSELLLDLCDDFRSEYIQRENAVLMQSSLNLIWTLSLILTVSTAIYFGLYKSLKKLFYKTIEAFIFILFIVIFEFYFFTHIISAYNVMPKEEASCLLYSEFIDL